MALVVEDGTGVTGANSYVALADFKAYVPRGGLSIPGTASDADLEAALIRGTAALDAMFGDQWPGKRILYTQSLDWPRYGAWDRDGLPLLGLPQAIKNACCEAALVEANEIGALSKKREVGLVEQSVGSISQKWTHAPGMIAYPAIRQQLVRILKAGGGIALTRC